MEFFVFLLICLGLAALFWLLTALRRLVTRIIVFEYERGVLYKEGKFERLLEPGPHWTFPAWHTVQKMDMRQRFITVVGQEVLSADNVPLKVSLAARYEVVDVRASMLNSADYQQALYLELQLALREIVASVPIDELLTKRQSIGEQLLALTEARATSLGLRLLAADIKDVMFPGEIKRMFAEVVRAQKEGLAALERARGESAALRSLANAAKLLEGNPALLQLRLLQTVSESKGNTIVLGLPSQTPIVPLRGQSTIVDGE
ncbi:MAG: slipin family protein [Ardenticatenales bacterium]|nr:slipin family protein [Ardenticatenales bacterium]